MAFADGGDDGGAGVQGLDAETAADFGEAGVHAGEADASLAGACESVARDADAVVGDDDMGDVASEADQQPDAARTGVAVDIGDGLLGKTVDRILGDLRD